MRRRLANQIAVAEENRRRLIESLPKGVCPNCLKHIGRGLYGHQRNCDG